MPVRATENFGVVRDCQVVAVRAGEVLDGDFAAYLVRSGAPVVDVEDFGEVESTINDVAVDNGELDITGKIDDIVTWVGDDKDRAREALEQETAKGDRARPRLINRLTEVMDR